MRILMASQFFLPVVGGEERMVDTLAHALISRGHDVSVVTTSPEGEEPQPAGLRVHRVPTLVGRSRRLHAEPERRHVPPAPDPEAVVRLRRVIRRVRPDVVHAHNWLVHSVAAAMAGLDTPLVLTLHDHGLVCATKRLLRGGEVCEGPGPARCIRCAAAHYGGAKGVLTAALLGPSTAAVQRRVSLFLPVSEYVARRARLQERGLSYEVVPNFVPSWGAEEPAAVEGLPPGEFVAFVGDLTYDKGVQTAVDAVLGLRDGPPLVLVGRRFPREPLPDDPRIVVLGQLPHAQVLSVFRRSTLVLVPSIWPEPFGLVAIEAMRMARPLVVSDAGALPEIVAHGDCGLVVPPRDAPALRQAVADLLADPARRHQLGRAAYGRAERFSAPVVVPKIENLYQDVVDRRIGRPAARAPRDAA